MMNTVISNKECCGCKLCQDSCPKDAIRMVEGELGNLYPLIDEKKCVNCQLCVKICPAHKELQNQTQETFAAVNTDREYLLTSASGGAFSALAVNVLKCSGVVYGATMLNDFEGILKAKHIRVDSIDDLRLLQGSKYLHSDMSGMYAKLKADIEAGRVVLFSGTPCQVAAVKSYCGCPENLILVEIICHGTPSQKLFSDYLHVLQKANGAKSIKEFRFRTKESGWGLCASLVQEDKKGRITKKRIPCNVSSYYKMFLNCETYRQSCYQCKYARPERVGDLTLGDYWGVEKDANLYNTLKSEGYEITEGVSCVIASSKKGADLLRNSGLRLIDVSFDSMARENGQLTHPSKCPNSRSEIEGIYQNKGYAGLENRFNQRLGMRKYGILLRNKIPPKIRMGVRMILKPAKPKHRESLK